MRKKTTAMAAVAAATRRPVTTMRMATTARKKALSGPILAILTKRPKVATTRLLEKRRLFPKCVRECRGVPGHQRRSDDGLDLEQRDRYARAHVMGLDTVELILTWEDTFGISISDAEARSMFNTRQVVAGIFEKVKSEKPEDGGCLALRAFLRLRHCFKEHGLPAHGVRPDTALSDLLPGAQRRDRLNAVITHARFTPMRRLPFGLQFAAGRLRDVIADIVIRDHTVLRMAGHGWSRRQVRELVRAVVYRQFALRKYSDEARFVKDLGLD